MLYVYDEELEQHEEVALNLLRTEGRKWAQMADGVVATAQSASNNIRYGEEYCDKQKWGRVHWHILEGIKLIAPKEEYDRIHNQFWSEWKNRKSDN